MPIIIIPKHCPPPTFQTKKEALRFLKEKDLPMDLYDIKFMYNEQRKRNSKSYNERHQEAARRHWREKHGQGNWYKKD